MGGHGYRGGHSGRGNKNQGGNQQGGQGKGCKDNDNPQTEETKEMQPLEILKIRLAKGEITEEEYQNLKKLIIGE